MPCVVCETNPVDGREKHSFDESCYYYNRLMRMTPPPNEEERKRYQDLYDDNSQDID